MTAAVGLTRGAADGGVAVLAGTPTHDRAALEALVRWDPAWFAERELADRVELGLPPAARVATLTVRDLRSGRRSPRCGWGVDASPRTTALDAETERLVLTAPLADGPALAAEVAAMRARRSARKEGQPVTARLDPRDPAR